MISPTPHPLGEAPDSQAARERQILENLLTTGPRLLDSRAENEILHLILRGVKQCGFDRVRLYLLSADGKYLTGKAQIGMENHNFEGVCWPTADDVFLQELIRHPRPRVFASEPGQPVHSEDRLAKQGVKEWACLPLRRGDRVIGMISADNKFSQTPIEELALALLAAFADQAAAAIETAQLHSQRLRERLRLIKVYRVISELFVDLGRLNQTERLQLIARRTQEMLNAEGCSILLVKEEGVLTLEAYFGRERGAPVLGRRFKIGAGAGLTGHLAAEGTLFNASAEQLIRHPAVRGGPSLPPNSRCHSLLSVPLKQGDGPGRQRRRLAGLLQVHNKRNGFGQADDQTRFTKEDERIIGIIAEAVVTALRASEWTEELNEIKRRKERVVATLPLAVISIDLRGNITEFNPQAEKIFKCKAGDVIGSKVNPLYFDPQEPAKIAEMLHREGAFYGYKTFVKTLDGERVPISLTAQWIEENGRAIGSIGFFEDLRSLKNAEKRLEMFLEASKILASEGNLDAGLNRLAQEMAQIFPGTFCRILLYDDNQQFLRTAAAYPPAGPIGSTLRWEPGVGELIPVTAYPGLRHLLRSGQVQIISSAKEVMRPNLEKFSARLKLDHTVSSLLVVPLVINGVALGMLDLGEVCRDHFNEGNIRLVTAIASQISVLIDRIQQLEQSQRRERLWKQLDEASEQLTALSDPSALMKAIPRLARTLAGAQAGGLFVLRRHHLALESGEGFSGLTEFHWPVTEGWVSEVWSAAEPLLCLSPGTEALPEGLPEEEFRTMCAAPLRGSAGEPLALLLIGDRTGQARFDATVLTFLRRFIAHASLALQTAQLLEEGRSRINQTSVLHRIRDFIQECEDPEKIFHAVLTGVTAGYGLGFNRAMLFLTDPSRRTLIGKMGIGQLEAREARSIWERSHRPEPGDCEQYLAALDSGPIELTAVGRIAREMCYSLEAEPSHLFAEIFAPASLKRPRHRIVAPGEFHLLPPDFVGKLKLETRVVVVPLVAKGRPMGLLIADNNFTDAPVTEEKISLLISFAATIATTIDNLQTIEQARQTLNSFQSANTALSRPQESPDGLLLDTIRQMKECIGAAFVGLMSVNQAGQLEARQTMPAPASPRQILARKDGVSAKALDTGQALFYGDVRDCRTQFSDALPASAQAVAVFPLLLPENRSAVLWAQYDQPQEFTEFKRLGLQLFARQVAIAHDHAERIKQMEIVIGSGAALAAADPASVPGQIVHDATELTNADAAIVFVYDEDENGFIQARSTETGVPPELRDGLLRIAPKERGTSFRVMQQGQLILNDLGDPQQREQLGERSVATVTALAARALHGLALKVGDEKLGLLWLFYKEPQELSEEKQKRIRAFVNQASLALKKARLTDQLKRAHQAVEVLDRVSRLGNRQAMLNSIVKKVKESLNCHSVVLFECDPAGKLIPTPTLIGVKEREKVFTPAEEKDILAISKMLRNRLPHFIEDSAHHRVVGKTRFVQEEKIQSSVIFPLYSAREQVGVLFINYRRRQSFKRQERETIRLLATRAADSLGVVQFMEEQKRSTLISNTILDTIHSNTSIVADRKAVLSNLLKRAVESISAQHSRRQAHQPRTNQAKVQIIGTIQFYDPQKQALEFYNIYPERHAEKIREQVGYSWSVVPEVAAGGRIGVTGRTVLTKRPQLVRDVRRDPHFLRFHPETCSELSVPLMMGDEIIGTLNIESNQVNGLDEKDQAMLEAMAKFAVDTIRREDDHQQRQAYLELARIGMASSTWWHTVRNNAVAIRDNVALLRMASQAQPLPQAGREALLRIERACGEMLNKPITAPLSSEEGVRVESIYALISERVRQVCSSQYPWIKYEFAADCDKSAMVKVSAAWFHRALDVLLDNAARAMESSPEKRLLVQIRRAPPHVEVVLADTGRGIPKHLEKTLLRRTVKSDTGMGIGLMIAQTIFRTYKGELLHPEPNRPSGTQMIFRLPEVRAELSSPTP